jgi:hypothetical protein
MRLRAPRHVTAAWLSTGPVAVKHGAVEIADDVAPGDLRGLAAAGFVALPPRTTAKSRPAALPEED